MIPTPQLDGDHLWASLEKISAFGATPAGGLHRLAASAEDGAARDYLVAEAKALGCSVRVDALGNTFVRRAGSAADAPAILIGSHLDSQPMAGKYDGTYGVVAGLEVLRTLEEGDIATAHPVEVVCWTNEEGARFAPAMMGSAFFAGRFTAEELLECRDTDGARLGESLASIGYAGTDLVSSAEHHCYLELHIEQGPLQQDEGLPIGVVTAVQGMAWFHIALRGQAGHSGTYPMERRRDAMASAAQLVTRVQAIGLQHPFVGRATVGRLDVTPSSPNVIPGRVELMVEFRHPEAPGLATMCAELAAACIDLEASTGVEITLEQVLDSPTVRFNAHLADTVETAAQKSSLTSRRMISGAGHDACQVAPRMPTAMIFIPCEQGISHAEDEAITPEWAHAGAQVLLQATLLADETMFSSDESPTHREIVGK